MRSKRLVTFFAITLTAAFLLDSCTTFPAPDAAHSTLIVGSIELTASGHPVGFSGNTVNGTHKEGIEITIENVQTKAKYVLHSRGDGLFFSQEVPAGDYSIKRFYYNRKSGGGHADTNTYPDRNRLFTIVEGKVNNLGSISWQSDLEERMGHLANKDYIAVRNQVASIDSMSQWLKLDWEEVHVQ